MRVAEGLIVGLLVLFSNVVTYPMLFPLLSLFQYLRTSQALAPGLPSIAMTPCHCRALLAAEEMEREAVALAVGARPSISAMLYTTISKATASMTTSSVSACIRRHHMAKDSNCCMHLSQILDSAALGSMSNAAIMACRSRNISQNLTTSLCTRCPSGRMRSGACSAGEHMLAAACFSRPATTILALISGTCSKARHHCKCRVSQALATGSGTQAAAFIQDSRLLLQAGPHHILATSPMLTCCASSPLC